MGKVRFTVTKNTINRKFLFLSDPEAIQGDYYPAADYEALEAERASLEADCDFANCRASECADELAEIEVQRDAAITAISEEGRKRGEVEAKLAALVEAAEKFSDRLDFVHEHDEFKAIWFLAHSHFGDYKGPRYEDEFNKLKAAITAAEGKKEG